MPRKHTIWDAKKQKQIDVPFTQEEEDARDAEESAIEAEKPMQDWKADMAATDKDMPRWMEDHITDMHDGVTGNVFTQEKYDAKTDLRAVKPNS